MLLLFVSFVWLGVVLLTSSTTRGYVSGSGGEATVDYHVNGTSYSVPISSFSTYSESAREVRVFYDTKDPSGGSSSGVEYWMPPTFFFVLGAFFLFVGAYEALRVPPAVEPSEGERSAGRVPQQALWFWR